MKVSERRKKQMLRHHTDNEIAYITRNHKSSPERRPNLSFWAYPDPLLTHSYTENTKLLFARLKAMKCEAILMRQKQSPLFYLLFPFHCLRIAIIFRAESISLAPFCAIIEWRAHLISIK
jgi:hypothetical protein